jgi:putative two-component system response regulator
MLLQRILATVGYQSVVAFDDPRAAVEAFSNALEGDTPFDLVCTDLHMPYMSGLEVIEAIGRLSPPHDFLPILVLTAHATPDTETKALALGASDFIPKPFNAGQIRVRVANLLRTRSLHRQLLAHTLHLEEQVRARTAELEAAHLEVLDRLAAAAEYRDSTTGHHVKRVGSLASLIAAEIGCDAATVDLIQHAATLHDVGKIGVPDAILLKPGRLTEQEFEVMKGHVDVGTRLLAHGRSALLRMAETIAASHHERWDGSGYPLGLRGDEIPLVGQIVAVADSFDTLMSERPYKRAWPLHRALEEMTAQRGTLYAPRVVDALLEVLRSRPEVVAEMEAAAHDIAASTEHRGADRRSIDRG